MPHLRIIHPHTKWLTSSCQNLSVLRLDGASLTPKGLKPLKCLKELTILSLNGCFKPAMNGGQQYSKDEMNEIDEILFDCMNEWKSLVFFNVANSHFLRGKFMEALPATLLQIDLTECREFAANSFAFLFARCLKLKSLIVDRVQPRNWISNLIKAENLQILSSNLSHSYGASASGGTFGTILNSDVRSLLDLPEKCPNVREISLNGWNFHGQGEKVLTAFSIHWRQLEILNLCGTNGYKIKVS